MTTMIIFSTSTLFIIFGLISYRCIKLIVENHNETRMITKDYTIKLLLLIITWMMGLQVMQAQINDKLLINAKPRKSDRELNNLIGKVKTFREEFFITQKINSTQKKIILRDM